MKKILLGTTALAAAVALSGGVAQAASHAEDGGPITVGLGGYYNFALGFVSQDDEDGQLADNLHSPAIGQDIELSVSGSTTLDNGITAGVSIRIEGNALDNASGTLDERFIFFRGNFGQIRLGSTEDARQEMTNFAPGGSGLFGVNTPFHIFWHFGPFVNVATYNDGLGNEDAPRILYFSPVFNGFRVGVSWAPSDNDFQQYNGAADNNAGALSDHLSASAEYSGNFGDFGVRVAGGYSAYTLDRCNAAACDNSPSSWHAGATVSYAGFSLGGGYLATDLINTNDRTDYDIGISYASGPFAVGAQVGMAEIDITGGPTQELSIYAINGSYTLGPGISLQAQVDTGELEDPTVANGAGDNDWVSVLVGTFISF